MLKDFSYVSGPPLLMRAEVLALIDEENAIREELKNCEQKLENIGSLAIRVQVFTRSVASLSEEDTETERLSKQADLFNKAILRLGNQRSKQRNEEKKEMERSKIDVQEDYLENSCTPQPTTDEDFFSSSTQRINNVLMNAMDAFDTVRRQNVYIDRTSERIRIGLSRIGISKQLIDQIDRRYLSDRVIFMGGVVLLILLFILVRFFF